MIVHPEFNMTLHPRHDIALLRTSTRMVWKLTDNGVGSVNEICLPGVNEEHNAGEIVRVSGWGKFNSNDTTIPAVMNAVEIPIVSPGWCAFIYEDNNPINAYTDDHICAGLIEKGGNDVCHGDSGGPLVIRQGYIYVLLGIVSFSRCGYPRYPGVYAKVSHYVNWIMDNTCM